MLVILKKLNIGVVSLFILPIFVSGYNETLIATTTLKDDLMSPGYLYNLDYGANLTYDYLVTTEYVYQKLTLTILDCEIEGDKNGACPYDHLYIFDGPNASSPLLDDFCCQGPKPSYITSGNQAYLSFETDLDTNFKGFKMSYVSTGVTTTTATTMTTIKTNTMGSTSTSPVPTMSHTDPQVHSPITGCHNGWLVFEGYCYLFGSDAIRFVEAEHYCRQHGGHLVEIFSSLENSFVKDELKKLGPRCTWAGMTDELTEGSWRWYTSQTPLNYSDWQPNEIVRDDQDCGVFWKDFGYKWADYFCADDCTPLCKQRGTVFPGIIG